MDKELRGRMQISFVDSKIRPAAFSIDQIEFLNYRPPFPDHFEPMVLTKIVRELQREFVLNHCVHVTIAEADEWESRVVAR